MYPWMYAFKSELRHDAHVPRQQKHRRSLGMYSLYFECQKSSQAAIHLVSMGRSPRRMSCP